MTAAVRFDTRTAHAPALAHGIARLKGSFRAWAETCYYIRTKAQRIEPLRLNAVQLALERAEREDLARKGEARLFALKARQPGVTTYEQAKSLHLVWGTPYTDALTLADARDRTDEIFEVTRRAIDHFPRALRPVLGEAQTREITFPGLDTRFLTDTARGEPGRGLTLGRLHCSEFAYFEDPEGALGSAGPALIPQGSVVVLETTASGHGSAAHTFWQHATEKGYRKLFFPWWVCDPTNYRLPLFEPDELGPLSDEERTLIAHHGVTLEQIKWRRAKIAEYDRTIFLQEYAEDEESCWAAAEGMFYDVGMLRELLLRAPAPCETHLNGTLNLYVGRDETGALDLPYGERLIGGCDTAEGGGGDREAWVIRSWPSWRLVATWEDRYAEPTEAADILYTWSREIAGPRELPFWVIEKNMHGITVLRRLRDVHDYPTDLLYHRAPLDESSERYHDRIGWATTGETKPLMLDAGRQLLKAAHERRVDVPSTAALRDALGVLRGVAGTAQLTGKDVLVSEMLAWLGRENVAQNESMGGALVTL